MADAPTAPGDDLAILYPDRVLALGGVTVTLREYRYREGLEALVLARPLLTELRALLTGDTEFAPEELDALIGRHRDLWLQLLALACGQPLEWIAQLPDHDAMELQMAFWEVNGPFFTRRLLYGAALKEAMRAMFSPPPSSSTTSSKPDSGATSTTSESGSPGASCGASTS